MKSLIVTTMNAPYWDGLVALFNSYLKNSSLDFDFATVVFGDDELAQRVASLGIRVVHNPPFPIDYLPPGKSELHNNQVLLRGMYGRMLVPSLFREYDRIVYIDSDALILQPLTRLVHRPMEYTLSATRCNSPLHENVKGRSFRCEYGPMSSFYVMDTARWHSHDYDAKWVEVASDSSLQFPYSVQGVLQATIGTDWRELPWHTQAHVGHNTFEYAQNREEVLVLHFMGTKPWRPLREDLVRDYKLRARDLWQTYYTMGVSGKDRHG